MNKKKSLFLLLTIPALILGACSKGQKSDSSNVEPSSSSVAQSTTSEAPSSSNPQSSSAPSSSSQQSSSSSSAPSPSPIKISVELGAFLKEGSYELEFDYNDSYFLTNPEEYNEDLSLLSFGAAISTGSVEDLQSFFGAANFNDIACYGYDIAPTEDTIGYSFAHKVISGYDLVAVTARGFNYGMEWANNFLIGEEGNHQGFYARAQEVYASLSTYVNAKCNTGKLKLWLTGYSRGGAIANVLSDIIVRRTDITVWQDSFYAYTFEAPAGLNNDDLGDYAFVHNIVNANDVVANVPPASYGLGRCGVDYPIYDENVSSIVKAFDEEAVISEFVETEIDGVTYKNDTELVAHLLDHIFNNQSEGVSEYTANNRTEYVNRYQTGIGHAFGYIFALSSETRQSIMDDLSSDVWTAMSALSSGENLALFLETYLDRDNISYVHEDLVADCETAINAIFNLFNEVLAMYLNEEYKPNLNRLISFHYPETVYALLLNAHNKVTTIME